MFKLNIRCSAHRIDCDHIVTWLSLQFKHTALHLASESGHDKVCQVLIQAGADIHAVTYIVSIRFQTVSVLEKCLHV